MVQECLLKALSAKLRYEILGHPIKHDSTLIQHQQATGILDFINQVGRPQNGHALVAGEFLNRAHQFTARSRVLSLIHI